MEKTIFRYGLQFLSFSGSFSHTRYRIILQLKSDLWSSWERHFWIRKPTKKQKFLFSLINEKKYIFYQPAFLIYDLFIEP